MSRALPPLPPLVTTHHAPTDLKRAAPHDDAIVHHLRTRLPNRPLKLHTLSPYLSKPPLTLQRRRPPPSTTAAIKPPSPRRRARPLAPLRPPHPTPAGALLLESPYQPPRRVRAQMARRAEYRRHVELERIHIEQWKREMLAGAERMGVDVGTFLSLLAMQHRDISPEDYDTLTQLQSRPKPATLPAGELEPRFPRWAVPAVEPRAMAETEHTAEPLPVVGERPSPQHRSPKAVAAPVTSPRRRPAGSPAGAELATESLPVMGARRPPQPRSPTVPTSPRRRSPKPPQASPAGSLATDQGSRVAARRRTPLDERQVSEAEPLPAARSSVQPGGGARGRGGRGGAAPRGARC